MDQAWASGTWVPTDQPPGQIVNNETWLERRQPIDRALVLCALFAILACLGALVCNVVKVQWAGGGSGAENLARGVGACLILACALILAFLTLAIVRIGRTAFAGRK